MIKVYLVIAKWQYEKDVILLVDTYKDSAVKFAINLTEIELGEGVSVTEHVPGEPYAEGLQIYWRKAQRCL